MNTFRKIGLLLCISLISMMLHSQVRPHPIFDNNMVLQRDKPVRIWGLQGATIISSLQSSLCKNKTKKENRQMIDRLYQKLKKWRTEGDARFPEGHTNKYVLDQIELIKGLYFPKYRPEKD